MSMSNNNIDQLFYSNSNLDNVYKNVCDDVLRRTNKDILNNSAYRATFNKMAQIVYDKCPPMERNLMNVNNKLTEKSVTFFHGKIFEKHVGKKPTEKQANETLRATLANQRLAPVDNNTTTQHGFTMVKDNEDLNMKMNELIAARDSLGTGAGIRGDGAVGSYMPNPVNTSNQYVNREVFVKGANTGDQYDPQFQRVADIPVQNNSTLKNMDFKINSFNLNDDMMDSLVSGENVDSPIYQNIENLQRMENTNPMAMLEDYQRQRNTQIKQYADAEKRQNITAMRTQPAEANNIIFDRNNTDAVTKIDQTIVDPMELYNLGNKLTADYTERMEERIVNDNNVQTLSPTEVKNMQEALIKYQRDTQPKYIEKVHYININSVDRNWVKNAENRYQFQVKFNQSSTYDNATIQQIYRNVVSVELVSAIMPMDAAIVPFDTRIYNGIMRYPYLLLRIDELDSVFRGTNNWTDRAFSTLIYDKVYFTNTLSNDYISGTNSIVQSTPEVGFAGEYLRGFMKFNPAYFEKKKFYNNPLASLNRMTITITDPRGNLINTEDDVLNITSIAFTINLNGVTGTELVPTFAYPYSTQSSYKMIKITTTTYFSNRLFRIGDRIIIGNFGMNALGLNNANFVNFINRPEGHTIINLDVETNGSTNTNNRGFLNAFYISPPGVLDSLNQTVNASTYYDDSTLNETGNTYGTIINLDLQTHLLFRIVTRDPDTSGTLNPINIY